MDRVKFLLFIVLVAFSCGKDEPKDQDVLINTLIGTWRFEDSTDNFSYELKFNENLTGNRIDSEGDDDNFTYTFTDKKINFTSGFPSGEYNYSIANGKLMLFGDTLTKQP